VPDAHSAKAVPAAAMRPTLLRPIRLLLVALSYFALGVLSSRLVPTADYALPLWPPAGFALAVLLIYGWRNWPSVFLGGVLVELWFHPHWGGLPVSLVCAAAMTLQAVLGAWLVRPVFQRAVPLARDSHIWHFLLLGGPVSCLVAASVGVAARWWSGRIDEPGRVLGEWMVWWGGDSLGVMLFAPLFLLMWPSQRRLWGRHRGAEAFPLLVTAGVLIAGSLFITRIERSAAETDAVRFKEEAFDAGFFRLPAELESLRGVERLFAASSDVTEAEFATFTRYITDRPELLGVDWAPRVSASRRAAFERQWRIESAGARRIFEPDGEEALQPASERPQHYPVVFRAAREDAGNGLGLDHAAFPARLAAIERASDSAAVQALPLADLLHDDRLGVLVFMPVYRAGFDPSTASPDARREAVSGMVVGRFDLVAMLAPLAEASAARGLSWRLIDVTAGEPMQLLGGDLPEQARSEWRRRVEFAGRVWQLDLQRSIAAVPFGSSLQSRLFLLLSVAAGFFAAYASLAAGGRHAATAEQVAERTAALQQELRARREAEQALRASEAQLDRFFSLSPDLFCVASTDGYFKRINPAFGQTLGWHDSELLDRPFLEFVHPDDVSATLQEVEGLRGGAANPHFTNRYRCKDGSWRHLAWRTVPQADGVLYATARDVTREHEMQQQLQQATVAAEQANRAKSAFLATMSHEIRTPMNGVLGTIELLDHSPLQASQRELLDVARRSAIALLTLIDDILDFSKIEAGRLDLDPAPVAIADMVEGLCSTMVPVAEHGDVELLLFCDPALPARVLADESRLRQVLFNLVGNAVKFSSGRPGQRGRVSVRVEPRAHAPQWLSFTVTDNGIGIAAEDVERVFDPFTQAELTTTRRFGGTGLGLAICKRLVELLGGLITLRSEPGKGSSFVVTLPLEPVDPVPAAPGIDLSGLECALIRHPALATSDLACYLRSAGASVTEFDNLPAVVADCAHHPTRSVVVVQAAESVTSADAGLFSDTPILRHVLVVRDRRQRASVKREDAIVLDGSLIRRHSLLRAVAAAAGRLSPEMSPPTGERLPTSAMVTDAGEPAGPMILVAEDDPINQAVIRQQLAVLGYRSDIVDDGEQALQRWRQGGHALLLTDLHMPLLDGYGLASAIRREEGDGQHLPIVALTANALRGEATRAFAAGIDDHLTKPVTLARLGAVLRARLSIGDAAWSSPPTHATPEDPVLHLARMRETVGDDESVIRRLLRQFLLSTRTLSAELSAALDAEDVAQVGRLAHRLKSASRSVGALALGDHCAALELASAEAQADAVAAALQRCLDAIDAVEARITQYLESEIEPVARAGMEVNADAYVAGR